MTVRLFSRPQVRPEQTAVLALGTSTAVAARRTLATDPLDFEFPGTLAAGTHWLRLRVDGVDACSSTSRSSPPSFDPDLRGRGAGMNARAEPLGRSAPPMG